MSTAGLIPSKLPNSLVHKVLLPAIELHPLVPLSVAARHNLRALVLLGRVIRAPKALKQLGKLGVARDVRGLEANHRVGGELPGRGLRVEDMALGRLGGKKVIIPGFAAHTARGVGHLCGRHGWVNGRIRLSGARENVIRAVGLAHVRIRCARNGLAINDWICEAVSRSTGAIGRYVTVAVSGPTDVRDVGLAGSGEGRAVGGHGGSGRGAGGVTAGHGVPASGHCGEKGC